MKNRIILVVIIVIVLIVLKNCGSGKESTEYDVVLHFDYETQSGLNYNDNALVYVDDEQVGVVMYGETNTEFKTIMKEGKHKVRLVSDTKVRKNKSNKVTIKVASTSDFTFKISQSSLTGLKLDLIE